MIPRTSVARQTPAWQRELAALVTDPAELLEALKLDPALLPAARMAAARFPLRVPWSFVRRMQAGDPQDPLLRQVLPLGEEELQLPGYSTDPVGDLSARAAPGLLHKYHGRVLLTVTGACAVHCRYCFRRHYPYSDESIAGDNLAAALAYVQGQDNVDEVILSGGDPLALSDRRIAELVAGLARFERIKRLRIHTRLPIVLPERVTDELLACFDRDRFTLVVVLHANHANEIDDSVAVACGRLETVGARLLNQSVLLRGVNNDLQSLVRLSERLIEVGVIPYYLHLLDRVQGAAHFDVPEEQARALHDALRARLPGYLVPRLVREEAGAESKTFLA